VNKLVTSTLDLVGVARASVEASINESVIRIAITGLSRAGKTVFLTSVIQNLVALGHGKNTLPRLTAAMMSAGVSRLRAVEVLPAGAAAVPYFDLATKFANLASDRPSWPPRTEDLAQVSLNLVVEREGAVWQKLGARRIRLEILDYPGEWLLDLPLLEKSFARWSEETLARLRRSPRAALCEAFFTFLRGFDSSSPLDDAVVRQGHLLYRRAIDECRSKLGMRYLQPGRFLCPGPRTEAPFMWFFPADIPAGRDIRGSAGAQLRDRFEAYKADMRASFFDTHFVDFDRQVVLVDVLGALHAGREAYEDTEQALSDVAACLDYGSNLPWPLQVSGAVGRQALARLFSTSRRPPGSAADSLGRTLGPRGIKRLAFVATKSDHVPAMQRDNLRNLVRAIAETVRSRLAFGGRPVSYHAAASVVSTRDSTASYEGRPVEVVLGVPVGSDRDRPFYPGEVPSARPRESFWGNRYFEMPVFVPPRIDPDGRSGIPHFEVDTILTALLEDKL
jgi:predicted YcjX-like family ATPase